MAQCPSCFQSLELNSSHHGTLFTCPSCQSVFFVGWDGLPEKSEVPSSTENPSPAGSSDVSPVSPGTFEPQSSDFAVTPNSFPMDFGASQQEGSNAGPSETNPQPWSPHDFSPETENSSSNSSTEFFNSNANANENDNVKANPFGEVIEFANSTESQSPITYTVTIRGIDLSAILDQLREALTDSRFQWKTEEILQQISAGELVLKDLSTAKASVIIQRIKFLPVDVDWSQNARTV